MNPRARQLHARGSISSYLEQTAKHLIMAAASAVINALCPAGGGQPQRLLLAGLPSAVVDEPPGRA